MIVAALLLMLAASAPLEGAEGAADAFSPCDCNDLPRLFEEMLEQEALKRFTEKTPPNDEFQSKQDVQDRLKWRLDQYTSGRRAAKKAAGQAVAPAAGSAGPAYGTNFFDPACGLLKYPPKLEDGTEPPPEPTTEEEVQKSDCSAITKFLLDHEKLHQERCRDRFKKEGNGRALLVPQNYLEEDRDAYDRGVKTLRREIARLAQECGWKGSTRKIMKDGRTVVPTEPQIQELKSAAKKKAQALRKGAKR
jgi:hypothetical protein